MGWRRKRKEDEKGPSGKGQSKKKAVAEVTTQPAAEDIPAADEDAPVEVNRAHGAFFGCYLLSSLNPKKKNSTYIGFTVNPARRLRQHNGELTSGAYRTKRMRPVEMVLVVYGFPSMVHALQFEWAWQHPTVSLAVKEVAATIKNRATIKGKIALLYAMLKLPKWNKLPLVVQFVSSRHVVHKLGLPPLPDHMDCLLAPLSSLRLKVDETAQDPPILDPPSDPPANEPTEVPRAYAESDDDSDEASLSGSSGAASPGPTDPFSNAPLEVPLSQAGASGWADPLADWTWLDEDEPDRHSSPTSWGKQEQERADPFATWQRLKAPKSVPKGSPKKGSGQLGAGLVGGTGRGPEPEADFGKSTGEEDSDAKWVLGEREEVFRKKAVKGKVGADWQPARCADAFDCDEGEDLKAGMSPERVDDVDISLPLWERLERARDGTTKAGTANGARQKDTVDLVSRVKASLIGEEQSKKLEMQTWRDWDDGARQCSQAQEAPSFLGVELVVLEDSPGPQKPIVAHKSTQRAQPREATNTKVRDAESVCRGKLEGSVKQIHKNRIRLSTERVVIDLDP